MLYFAASWCTACQEVTHCSPIYTAYAPHQNFEISWCQPERSAEPAGVCLTAPPSPGPSVPFDDGGRVTSAKPGIASTSFRILVCSISGARAGLECAQRGQCGTLPCWRRCGNAGEAGRESVCQAGAPLADGVRAHALAVHLGRGTSKTSPALYKTARSI